ncbi:MAG: alpha/beta fold hydrolase [Patescibacteria group bacterium]|nr:alpha/beta fold hydrolase [Patescibacteria group bacterium]
MKKTEVEFKVGKDTLRGTLFIPSGKGPFPGVIFYHGRGSTRARYLPMAETLAQKGFITLAFDFRGCGESDGKFEAQSHKMGIEDARAGLEFLLSQNVDKKRIGIQSTSFGGYCAGMVLKDYDFIKSVVLRVPAAYSDNDLQLTPEKFPEYVYFQNRENWIDSSAYNGLKKFRGSLLVIESEKDELLPSEEVQKYYNVATNAAKRKLSVHKNAGHNLSDNPKGLKEFYEITVNWFLETL